MRFLIDVSRDQRLSVNEVLVQGSNPRPGFFGMVALSALIAGFGLIMDSTAVVIGAMLVAPLMTPILGISLAMVRGDPLLLGTALRSELAGVGIAVLATLLLGLAIPYFESTPEMLSRTQPNLLDLLVALLAGAAGAYALVDERLSPALPGVAIATAIVPPLANTGLSAALGAQQGAWGSFLLFFTNFVAILLSASVVFLVSGFGRVRQASEGRKLGGRLAVTAASVAAVGIFLGFELSNVIDRERLNDEIRRTLQVELPRYRVSEIVKLSHSVVDDQIVVLAHVHAPLVVRPRAVKDIEEGLEARLGREFQLFVRTTLTENVSATGSMRQVVSQSLDGFTVGDFTEESKQILRTEQILREYLASRVGLRLERIERLQRGEQIVFFVETTGLRNLRHSEIIEMDRRVAAQLAPKKTQLSFIQDKRELVNREGAFRWELRMRGVPSEEVESHTASIRHLVGEALAQLDTSIINASFNRLAGGYHAFFEVAGPRRLFPADVAAIEASILSELGFPCEVFLRPVPDSVISAAGHATWDEILSEFGRRTREFYAADTQEILEDWR